MIKQLKNIKWIMLDVDGTLTDGGIEVSNSGDVTKRFNVRDGFGIVSAQKMGYQFAIITGRKTEVIRLRLQEELKIQEVHQGVKDKYQVLEQLKGKYNIKAEEIAYMGDDINDLGMKKHVGIFACPHDAVVEIRVASDMIMEKNGGHGAVRELIEEIMRAQGTWDKIIESYEK